MPPVGVTITTPFPAVVAEPGSSASFKLTLDVPTAQRVDLKAEGVPSGWTAQFRGGGSVVDGAYVDPKAPPEVTLSVSIPKDATAGTSTIRVVATGTSGVDTLPLSIRVAEAAAGDVTLTSDFPELKGPSTSTFTFNLTLTNGTATESQFSMDATGPDGWTVAVKPAGPGPGDQHGRPGGRFHEHHHQRDPGARCRGRILPDHRVGQRRAARP